jgi:hypothetical protein
MRLLARTPVHKFRHSYVATNVTTAAWVEVISSLPQPVSAVEIYDSSGKIIKLSIGASGEEDANELDYYITPGGSGILLPLEFSKGARISAKAVDDDADVGSLIFNFFG